MTRLWIRADGSATLGLGHVMRTLAIAERAHTRGIETRYLVGGSKDVAELVAARGFQADYVTPSSPDVPTRLRSGDAIVFDGYHFAPDLMEGARHRGCRVGAIDDLGTGEFPVDVLLNQNPGRGYDYRTRADTTVLLGPEHALVRDEFTSRRRVRSHGKARTLIVTTGGSDVAGLNDMTVSMAPSRPAFDRVVMVVGPAADFDTSRPLTPGVEVLHAPSDLGAVFDSADAVVSAAGSTTWELLCMGLPAALVEVADNQRGTAEALAQLGVATFMGQAGSYEERFVETLQELADAGVRERLSRRSLDLVDGHGADRFLAALLP